MCMHRDSTQNTHITHTHKSHIYTDTHTLLRRYASLTGNFAFQCDIN